MREALDSRSDYNSALKVAQLKLASEQKRSSQIVFQFNTYKSLLEELQEKAQKYENLQKEEKNSSVHLEQELAKVKSLGKIFADFAFRQGQKSRD